MRYTAGTPLERLFPSPQARVLDFLMLRISLPATMKDLQKHAEMPARTLQRTLPYLVKEKLVTRARTWRGYEYELNLESERTRAFLQYCKTTIRQDLQISSYYKK